MYMRAKRYGGVNNCELQDGEAEREIESRSFCAKWGKGREELGGYGGEVI